MRREVIGARGRGDHSGAGALLIIESAGILRLFLRIDGL
jgi:hypothetical protein